MVVLALCSGLCAMDFSALWPRRPGRECFIPGFPEHSCSYSIPFLCWSSGKWNTSKQYYWEIYYISNELILTAYSIIDCMVVMYILKFDWNVFLQCWNLFYCHLIWFIMLKGILGLLIFASVFKAFRIAYLFSSVICNHIFLMTYNIKKGWLFNISRF